MTDRDDVYEQPQLLREYLLFHYGSEAQIFSPRFATHVEGVRAALDFPLRCVERLIGDVEGGRSSTTAYDLGCAVGRSTFELARYAAEVTGYDLSAQFIAAANRLRDEGQVTTAVLNEGAMCETVTLKAPTPPGGAAIAFEVGDALALAETLPPADLVLAANLLCRLPAPARFLEALPRLIKPGGQLLLVTPFTWLEAFTPRDAWPLDGQAQPMDSEDWIKARLDEAFTLEHREDLPFLIREHRRKFQWTLASGTRWRRRESGSAQPGSS